MYSEYSYVRFQWDFTWLWPFCRSNSHEQRFHMFPLWPGECRLSVHQGNAHVAPEVESDVVLGQSLLSHLLHGHKIHMENVRMQPHDLEACKRWKKNVAEYTKVARWDVQSHLETLAPPHSMNAFWTCRNMWTTHESPLNIEMSTSPAHTMPVDTSAINWPPHPSALGPVLFLIFNCSLSTQRIWIQTNPQKRLHSVWRKRAKDLVLSRLHELGIIPYGIYPACTQLLLPQHL